MAGSLSHVTIAPSPTAVGGDSDEAGAPASSADYPVGGMVVSAIRPVTGQGRTAMLLGGSLGLVLVGVIVWAVARGRHAKTKEHPP